MQDAPSTLAFVKYHILGNSYLVLPPDLNPGLDALMEERALGEGRERALDPGLVRRICSLDYGIGSSGVVLGPLAEPDGGVALHIYNEDGTRCNFSGNAIRMLARHLVESGAVPGTPGTRLALRVLGHEASSGTLRPVVNAAEVEIAAEGGAEIRAFLAPPRIGGTCVATGPDALEPEGSGLAVRVPALAAIGAGLARPRDWGSATLVDMGNPHCVILAGSPEDLPEPGFGDVDRASLVALSYAGTGGGPLGEVFPQGCNLQFAYVEPGGGALTLRTFERGGGPTKSSGSSSSAAAAAAFARGLAGPQVQVTMPGGTMTIQLMGEPARITGVALGSAVVRIGVAAMDLGPDLG